MTEIRNVRDLKAFLADLPKEADDWDIIFGAKKLKGLYQISGAVEAYFNPDDIPEGFTENFILLFTGEKP